MSYHGYPTVGGAGHFPRDGAQIERTSPGRTLRAASRSMVTTVTPPMCSSVAL